MRTSIGTAAAAALACGLLTAACTGGGATKPSAAPPVALGGIKLVSYSGCDDMLEGLRGAAAKNVGPWGLGGNMIMFARGAEATASQDAKAAPAYSTTNVHEAGVDEPDMVKTDGKRIISYAAGVLRVVDVASKKETGTLRLVPEEQYWAPGELLVHGDRALVIFSAGDVVPLGATVKRPAVFGPRYMLVDLKDMKPLGTITPKGSHVDARMTGSTVRLVVRSQPDITFPDSRPNQSEDELVQRNRDVVRKAPIDAWLPTYEVSVPGQQARTEKLKCEQVSHPDDYTGTSLLSLHTIDLEAGLASDDPIAVAADGDTVYATPTSLYVTSNPRYWWPRPIDARPIEDTPPVDATPVPDTPAPTSSAPVSPGAAPADSPTVVAPRDPVTSPPAEKVEPSADPSMPTLLPEPTPSPSAPESPTATPPTVTPSPDKSGSREDQAPPDRTEVHRFDISGVGAPRYVASGAVPGRLLNQYSLSDFDGHLRVATTVDAPMGGPDASAASSGVYVLKADTLAQVGQVTGLGKGERIYSVRFIGPVGYVVTFKQVDPLYTLDLRDPARPAVTGELKITGYSAYLHPAGDGRLLGIGQEASTQGRTLGMQVSLFDVADPAAPKRLSQFHQKESASEAEWDPHAFLYWPDSGLAVLPVSSWGGSDAGESDMAAMVLKVGDDSITQAGLVRHPKPAKSQDPVRFDARIQRSLIIGDTLWTLSGAGLKASDTTTLADQAWIPFRV